MQESEVERPEQQDDASVGGDPLRGVASEEEHVHTPTTTAAIAIHAQRHAAVAEKKRRRGGATIGAAEAGAADLGQENRSKWRPRSSLSPLPGAAEPLIGRQRHL
jgi:hypothetical protein